MEELILGDCSCLELAGEGGGSDGYVWNARVLLSHLNNGLLFGAFELASSGPCLDKDNGKSLDIIYQYLKVGGRSGVDWNHTWRVNCGALGRAF